MTIGVCICPRHQHPPANHHPPDPGLYDEFFYCDMYDGNLGGELVTRIETLIVAPLGTVRDP